METLSDKEIMTSHGMAVKTGNVKQFIKDINRLIDTLHPKKNCAVIHQIKNGIDKLAGDKLI